MKFEEMTVYRATDWEDFSKVLRESTNPLEMLEALPRAADKDVTRHYQEVCRYSEGAKRAALRALFSNPALGILWVESNVVLRNMLAISFKLRHGNQIGYDRRELIGAYRELGAPEYIITWIRTGYSNDP